MSTTTEGGSPYTPVAAAAVAGSERVAELTRQYEEVSTRMLEADRESGELVRLYVALRQLYEAPDRAGVFAALAEIIVSVIGSETFAVFEADTGGTTLTLVDSMGIDAARYREVSLVSHPIGRLAAAGELHVGRAEADALGLPHEPLVAAVVPLRFGRILAGAIVIFRLLPHRDGLDTADLDLLQLLSLHTMPAARLAAVRTEAERQRGASA